MRLLVPILLALLLGSVVPEQGRAQPASPREIRTKVPWIRAEEVPTRAGVLLRRLEGFPPDTATQSKVEQIEQGLAQLNTDLDDVLQRTSTAVRRATPFVQLEDLRRELVSAAAPLVAWEAAATGESKRVLEQLDEIAHAREVWSATRDRPETAAAGDVVARRVQASLEELANAAAGLQAWRTRVLALDDRLVDRRAAVDTALGRLREATILEQRNLLVPGRAPLWQTDFAARLRSELPRVPEEFRAYARGTRAYVEGHPRPLVLQALLAVLLMFFLGRLSTIDRPYSLALLLALLASPQIQPLAPQRFIQALGVAALLPTARILIHATKHASVAAFLAIFVSALTDRLVLTMAPLPAVSSASFLLALVIEMGLVFWFARRTRRAGDAPWLSRGAYLAMLGLGLALLAEIGGWTNLATLLGRGILAGVTLAVFVGAAVIGLEPVFVYLLSSPTLRRSHLFDRNTAVLQQRVGRALRWLGTAFWFYLLLRAGGIQSTALEALHALLHAGIEVGALSLSVGSVLAFALTLLTAMLLAQFVHGVLEEDVYPRTNLPRGIPYVFSTLVRYAVYSLGFLLALAAAGVHLSQLTILLGGLGVGIGLGLQDLVKNFAAGLTLLLERRVHMGDTLQIPSQQISGQVLSIGLRATVVRSGNGSEVVVPNADLIAGAITNWTLSDRLCRIEVPVGVTYGTDPDRVVALLLEVARSVQPLLAEPPPQALFKGFGESSLDFVLRAWTDRGFDQATVLTSELALAMLRALRAAEIGIPFPQRDLHLASVAPEVRTALAGLEQKEGA